MLRRDSFSLERCNMLAAEKRLFLFSVWWKTFGGLCLAVALASGCSQSFEAKRPDDSGQAIDVA